MLGFGGREWLGVCLHPPSWRRCWQGLAGKLCGTILLLILCVGAKALGFKVHNLHRIALWVVVLALVVETLHMWHDGTAPSTLPRVWLFCSCGASLFSPTVTVLELVFIPCLHELVAVFYQYLMSLIFFFIP